MGFRIHYFQHIQYNSVCYFPQGVGSAYRQGYLLKVYPYRFGLNEEFHLIGVF